MPKEMIFRVFLGTPRIGRHRGFLLLRGHRAPRSLRQLRAQPAAEWAQPPFSGRGSLGVCVQDRVRECPSLLAAGRELHTVWKIKQDLKIEIKTKGTQLSPEKPLRPGAAPYGTLGTPAWWGQSRPWWLWHPPPVTPCAPHGEGWGPPPRPLLLSGHLGPTMICPARCCGPAAATARVRRVPHPAGALFGDSTQIHRHRWPWGSSRSPPSPEQQDGPRCGVGPRARPKSGAGGESLREAGTLFLRGL